MKRLLLTALILFPVVSQAEPWCLRLDQIENCGYISSDACYSAVQANGGACYPNAREVGVKGDAPICMITSTLRKCTFRSMRSCNRAINTNDLGSSAGCVENTEKALEYTKNNRKSFTDVLRQNSFE